MPSIVNGVDTLSYPTVGVPGFLDNFSNPTGGGCSGTLIGCQTFLTAAHCVCPEGTTDTSSCLAAGGPTSASNLIIFLQNAGFFYVSRVTINPAYSFGVGGDVAVLTLTTPVAGIAPSRINTTGKPPYGTPGSMVGYGGTGGTINPGPTPTPTPNTYCAADETESIFVIATGNDDGTIAQHSTLQGLEYPPVGSQYILMASYDLEPRRRYIDSVQYGYDVWNSFWRWNISLPSNITITHAYFVPSYDSFGIGTDGCPDSLNLVVDWHP